MRVEGPAAGIGGSLITRFDLTEEEAIKDAEAALRRCESVDAFAAWARTWGHLAMQRLRVVADLDEDSPSSEEFDDLRDSKMKIEDAADACIEEIRGVLLKSTGTKTDAILAAVEKFAVVLKAEEETEA